MQETRPSGGERPINWAALIETALLGLTAVLILRKAMSGVLVFYIHPRYAPLTILCGAALLLASGARMRGIFGQAPQPLAGRRLAYLLMLAPVLLGAIAPARPLGSAALERGGIGAPADTGTLAELQRDTAEWNLLHWAPLRSVAGSEALVGRQADLVGFVHHDPARPIDGFTLARYVVTCCAADGRGVTLPVIWPQGAALPPDTWVRVRGQFATRTIAGSPEAALVATSVAPIDQPSEPYLYP